MQLNGAREAFYVKSFQPFSFSGDHLLGCCVSLPMSNQPWFFGWLRIGFERGPGPARRVQPWVFLLAALRAGGPGRATRRGPPAGPCATVVVSFGRTRAGRGDAEGDGYHHQRTAYYPEPPPRRFSGATRFLFCGATRDRRRLRRRGS